MAPERWEVAGMWWAGSGAVAVADCPKKTLLWIFFIFPRIFFFLSLGKSIIGELG